MLTLLFIVLVALGVSFLCSVLEAALLSVRDSELAEGAAARRRGAALLLYLKTDRLDDSISAILILNTVAHTIGAAMAGAQAARVFGDAWVGVFSGVLTLLVLVVTEIIPKTIGASYASRLVPFVAYTLQTLRFLLYPALLLTRLLTGLIGRPEDGGISKGEVHAVVRSATESGQIQRHESQIVTNALRLGQVGVGDVMTPRTVVLRLPASTPASELGTQVPELPYTRVPIYDEGEEDVIGYVRVPDVLRGEWRAESDRTLMDYRRDISDVDMRATVGDALRELLRRGEHIALVRDGFGGLAGIVTLEDLIETLIGAEILDESDEVADLREFAIELRDRRLGRRHGVNAEATPDGTTPDETTPDPSADEPASDAATGS